MNDLKWIPLAEHNANDADLALRALNVRAIDAPMAVVIAPNGEVLDCSFP